MTNKTKIKALIRDLRADGKSNDEIAQVLNEAGYTTARGKTFDSHSVTRAAVKLGVSRVYRKKKARVARQPKENKKVDADKLAMIELFLSIEMKREPKAALNYIQSILNL